jgi:K+-sensing histidine kinase KdpD
MPPHRDASAELEEGRNLAARTGASLCAACVLPEGTATLQRRAPAAALAGNIALAQRLGATVVQVESGDVATALVDVAEREAVTHVVLGHTGDPAHLLRTTGVVGTFVRFSRGLEIRVIGHRPPPDVADQTTGAPVS